jgi:hypothetical protein
MYIVLARLLDHTPPSIPTNPAHAQSTMIAVTAYLSHNILPVGTHQVIDFDHVVINIGNCYHAHGGLFTATVPGIYMFSMSVMSVPPHTIDVRLVKHGSVLCATYANGYNLDVGACSATVHLAAGDDVWVKHWAGDGVHADHSSFTGVLIQSD